MLPVVGLFITIQPQLFLIAVSIAIIAAAFVALLLKVHHIKTRWQWTIILTSLVFVYSIEHTVLKQIYGINLTKIETITSLSHAKN